MRSFTSPICGGRPWWTALLLALGLPLLPLLTLAQHRPAPAGTPPAMAAGQPLRQALTPAGTLRPGARGSFDATGYRMGTDPATGQPVFQPNRVAGAGDESWQDGFGLPGNGLNNTVYALAVAANGDVLVGGEFTDAGGNANADRVARWDGTAWQALGTDLIGHQNQINNYILHGDNFGGIQIHGNGNSQSVNVHNKDNSSE